MEKLHLESFGNLYEKGLSCFRLNDLDGAVNFWEKAIEKDDSVANIYAILGNSYKILNRLDKSEKMLKKATELEPDNIYYLINYGKYLFEQKKFKAAYKILKKALDEDLGNYEILNDLGVISYYLKDFINAENHLNKSLKIFPDYKEALINLYYVYLESGENRKKAEIISHLKEKFPEDNLVREIISSDESKSEINFDKNLILNLSGEKYSIKPLEMIEKFEQENLALEPDLSIVIPIMNEKDNIPILYAQITKVLKAIEKKYEIIFIDDGSTDGSLIELIKLSSLDNNVKIIQFRKNYGQTAAMSAGFKFSTGKVVITMDGDLQNDPADIPALLKKMSEGYDLVSGWRKDRKDKNLTRKIPSKIANKIINKLIEGTNIQLHDFGCTLKAYKKNIVKNIQLYGEMHRFIPVFAAWLGVNVTEIPVHHHPRIHGHAKYNLSRVSRVIFDLLVVRFFSDYLTRPIQFFGKIAKNIFGFGSLGLATLTILKYIYPQIPLSYGTFLILFGILISSSFNLVILGLLGEIMMRIYFESQKKDSYIVEKIIQNEGR
jgi:glycosyltransferase involved in cell wall biosynthesis